MEMRKKKLQKGSSINLKDYLESSKLTAFQETGVQAGVKMRGSLTG